MINNKYTSAAKLLADLIGDPKLEDEVKKELARRKKINALVAERAKANLTMRDVARRMNVSVRFVETIEEKLRDEDIPPAILRAYTAAIRNSKTKTKSRGVVK